MAKVLFQMSGSIAAYKACHVISRLVQAGCEVQVVATRSALEFVGRATLEGLTGRAVHSDTFAPSAYMSHIHLIRWADMAVLCPATANTLNKLTSGIGDDLLTTLFLAHDFKKPYLVAPAMNVAMFHHPTTQTSLHKLREWGVEILDTAEGMLACGEVGEGKLQDPENILNQILLRLKEGGFSIAPDKSKPAISDGSTDPTFDQKFDRKMEDQTATSGIRQLHVLITSGGTKIPIDSVRSLTNTSTGLTGAVVAEYFASQGHQVTYLHAQDAVRPETSEHLQTDSFVTFADLEECLRRSLGTKHFDAVIHLAAVSDYDLSSVELDGRTIIAAPAYAAESSSSTSGLGKIESGENLTLHLRRNPKLLPQLKSFSRNKEIIVVGFKLTSGANLAERRAAVEKIGASADLIVHNDLQEIAACEHLSSFYEGTKSGGEAHTKSELAAKLEDWLQKKINLSTPENQHALGDDEVKKGQARQAQGVRTSSEGKNI